LAVHAAILAISFAIILAGSELFTNGVEWAGHRLAIAEATVGSILAAVGTAMPETLVPAVALLTGRNSPQEHEAVGIGAIVGAPLMLSTVALLVMGVAVLGFRKRRGRSTLRVSSIDARRDLAVFLPVFIIVLAVGTLEVGPAARRMAAAALLLVYAAYSASMLRMERADDAEVEHGLYAEALLRGTPMEPRMWATLLQVVAGTVAILMGARMFVEQTILISAHANLNPGVLSLILSPLATELPEKYNSVIWIRRGKDHLALANITGAMVFQACIPVAIGLAFTPWHLTPAELLAGIVAIGSAAILYANLRDGEIGTRKLMIGGAAYAIFLAGLFYLGTR
jgi:cation:H+ antiporter